MKTQKVLVALGAAVILIMATFYANAGTTKTDDQSGSGTAILKATDLTTILGKPALAKPDAATIDHLALTGDTKVLIGEKVLDMAKSAIGGDDEGKELTIATILATKEKPGGDGAELTIVAMSASSDGKIKVQL